MLRLVTFPVRAGVHVGATGTKVGYRTARLLGFRRLFLLGVGIAIGLLIAPVPGRQLRAKLAELAEGATRAEPLPDLSPADATAAGDIDKVLQVSGTNGSV
jgi:hypothetical protein